jgi:hypothetical protein
MIKTNSEQKPQTRQEREEEKRRKEEENELRTIRCLDFGAPFLVRGVHFADQREMVQFRHNARLHS